MIVTVGAARGLERCRQFLACQALSATQRAGQTIRHQLAALERQPELGQPFSPEEPELRQLVIPFGRDGYVALYRYKPGDDALYVLAFRHQKEAGYDYNRMSSD